MNKPKVICVDMDGTLCSGMAWKPSDIPKLKPKKDIIEKVNRLSMVNFIVIYTARRDHLIYETLLWLRKHGVRYHAISNLKIGGSVYIDDKALNIKDFRRGKGRKNQKKK